MSDIIKLLPDAVANQIAAGEVIQRPASVVKELVENAIDAGAHRVQIVVTDAGKTCLQVVDDGSGMSDTDARLSFERHATSKISAATDLFTLRTMGFRGEALASIAAVAQVELKTRVASSEVGTCLRIEGSRLIEQVPTACPIGSNFIVRNLFFNIPARRKFLKSNQTEMANVMTEFERVALAHPDVAFTLYNGDTVVQQLAVGNFHQRIVALFGKRLNSHLLPVEVETTLAHISGFVGAPDSARKKGAHQFFFANGRFMRHPYFAKAVAMAYERLIADGEQVPFFININVDPSRLDVNIHPSKTEIKFQDDQALWQILLAAVREALGKFNAVPTIDFDTTNRPDIPAFNPEAGAFRPIELHIDKTFNPFETHSSARKPRPSEGWEKAYAAALGVEATPFDAEAAHAPRRAVEDEAPTDASLNEDFAPHTEATIDGLLQYCGRYIVAATPAGLCLIDQNRAHRRILYDLYMQQLTAHKGVSQGVLFPQMVQLSPSAEVVFKQLHPHLTDVGFDFSPLGGGSYSILGIPAGTEGLDPERLFHAVLTDAMQGASRAEVSVCHFIAAALARQAAMPIGQALTEQEMRHLIEQLYHSSNANYAPDGKVIQYRLTPERLEKFFG